MRQIVLDTETTGLDPAEGHRIIEIGCVELIDRRRTDNRFHIHINPERDIDEGALEVHGIDSDFLADKPKFADVADDLVAFLGSSEIIIHNAPFDVGFLNQEFKLLGGYPKLESLCDIVDSLVLARKKHPGQRNSLDALCGRYGIDNSHRERHGALLDAEILADVYLAMTGGQTSLLPDENDDGIIQQTPKPRQINKNRPKLKVIYCNEKELQVHSKRLDAIDAESGGSCLWKQSE